MRLLDYLSVPYRLHAETVELPDGSWVRRLSYPELPDCSVESIVLEDALRALERRRIETVLRMAAEGAPAVPRPPLANCDPVWIAKQVGVAPEVVSLIERDRALIAPGAAL